MGRKKWRVRRYHIGIKVRITFWVVLILIFSTIGLLFMQKIMVKEEITKFFYSENSNLDYKVCMNDFVTFPEQCLAKDRQYIATAIDYIDSSFKYNFSASELFDYTYSYYVEAKYVVFEKGGNGKIIDDAEEIIVAKKEFKMIDSSDFIINPNVEIDYAKYNTAVQDMKRKYNLSLESTLTVTMYITVEGTHENIEEGIVINQAISMEIPLTEQTVDVSLSYKDVNQSELIKSSNQEEVDHTINYLICILCVVFDILAIIKLIQFLSKITVTKTMYERTLARISREYNQIIVETKNLPPYENSRIIEVKSFEELLDAREVIGKPILSITINSQKTWFMIVNGEEIYKFVLKAVDLENE